jgi:hypothetical protein
METADLSTALRSGRDDKGEWGASRESICWIKGGREVMNSGSHFATAADGSAPLPVVISTGEVMGLRPPKVMKNGFCSATTLNGSAALPFVISTGAPKERSGEICGPSLEMSSRPERTAVERSVVSPPALNAEEIRNSF